VNRRLLGRTRLAVSEVGFGAWAIGGNRYGNSYGATDDAESIRAVRRAVELGCNCFDTADVYGHGHSEELLGKALADRRGDVIIITKVGGNFYNRDLHPLLRERVAHAAGVPYSQIPPDVPLPVTHDANFSSDYIRFALGRSLERLQTAYVDLLLLHNPSQAQIADMATYGVLEDLKRERTIRAYGVSVHSPEEGLAAIQSTMPDVVELVYNLARREAESAFFPAARAADVGVIAREPLANGFLAGRYAPDSTWDAGDIRARMPQQYVAQMAQLGHRVRELSQRTGCSAAQLALKFVLDNSAVSTVIVGTKTAQQADENFDVET
jgi:aryl-alcohol dehydrogenase-like predicted oxidoreductase